MRFSRYFLNRLQDQAMTADVVVVIDVLRSFTTAAVALAQGARAIYPVAGIAAAAALRDTLENPVTIGAVGGGDPIPGFDFGNSPASLLTADLSGKAVVLSTAAGVCGLQRFRRAPRLYAASMVCAGATAAAIRAARPQEVCFVITGEWVDRNGDEDVACADYLEALLQGRQVAPEPYLCRIAASDFGQRFTAGTWPNLPGTDLALACEVDRYAFPMPVGLENGHLVIR